ncbi:LutC/YkgG family protein [Kurthia sibirica]|uniref:Lactate utilization protein C n=1 Tax=Kurthia sibirica TaxID=202750 RepID=A0A2U3AG93_9BACL|nr:lactate utilization protein C [Kurthia sibirica]PWI23559.1 lactate utilization protein C [Kurthia sibirica]GEK35253.1 lactate utilization protein C [Kurthia sibirica]
MIRNREKFLSKITTALERPFLPGMKPEKKWQHHPEEQRLSKMSIDELLPAFIEQCSKIHTDVVTVDKANLTLALHNLVVKYGGESVALWQDERLTALGISKLCEDTWPTNNIQVHIWDPTLDRTTNFERTNASNIGIAFAEYALAESGTVVLQSAAGQGKAIGLLPNAFIAIVNKSTLKPRITQAVAEIHQIVEAGELLPASIDFVSGPSNSADIEMDLVVGVHGPIYVTYIVVTDE